MSQSSNQKSFSRMRIAFAAAAVALTIASSAMAQFRIDNSNALDKNNRLGSDGFNQSNLMGSGRFGNNGLAGNFIVTGNVSGGRAFRGSLGYTDPNAFRGTVAGANVDTFLRSSSGVSGRGTVVNNANSINPFFGRSTVATPQGFQSRIGGGVIQNNAPRVANSFDTRMDFGGLTRQQISNTPSRINLVRPSDGGGVSGILGQPLSASMSSGLTNSSPRAALPESLADIDILSEYTALTRRGDLTPSQTTSRDQRPGSNDLSVLPSNQINPNRTEPDSDPNRLTNSTLTTGQGSGVRDLTSPQRRNTQLNELQRRLDEMRDKNSLGGKDANTIRDVANERVRRQQEAARRAAEEDRKNPSNPSPVNSTPTAPNSTAPDTSTPVTPGASATEKPAQGSSVVKPVTPTTVPPANVAPNTPDLNLPRLSDPQTKPEQAGPEQANPQPDVAPLVPAAPISIRKLSDGTTGELSESIGRAEKLMLEGKFTSAIDQFDAAERISPDDPMIFMGRSIAELGASYFRRAEVHLRQAFERSPELLLARYDLKNMIGDARLEFLVGELKQLATTNANDPGPLMLLAFIHYSVEDTTRAAALLAEAQRRSPNDQSIKLMQATWQLSAPASDNK
jgi:tetratricopeptide (TPR) repeat protein